jgi:hypothetical protein
MSDMERLLLMSGAKPIDRPDQVSIGKVARRDKEKIKMEPRLGDRLAQVLLVRIGRFAGAGEERGNGPVRIDTPPTAGVSAERANYSSLGVIRPPQPIPISPPLSHGGLFAILDKALINEFVRFSLIPKESAQAFPCRPASLNAFRGRRAERAG